MCCTKDRSVSLRILNKIETVSSSLTMTFVLYLALRCSTHCIGFLYHTSNVCFGNNYHSAFDFGVWIFIKHMSSYNCAIIAVLSNLVTKKLLTNCKIFPTVYTGLQKYIKHRNPLIYIAPVRY